MPNGGESGRQLDRLQDQVDATRADLTDMAGAVNGLRELVTELVRRSGADHQAERWQARLGSLETRLEMLETAIRSEVERVRAAAGAVDALADDFRSTVGDTQSLVGLASEIGNRLDVLEGLERQVRGAAQDVAGSVSSRLDRDAADRDERDRALADRITETIAQSRDAVNELAGRLDAIARTTSDLAGVEERLTAHLRESLSQPLGTLRDDLAGVRSELDASTEASRRATTEALAVLSTELAAFENRLADTSARDTRLDELFALVTQLRSQHPELESRLDGVARDLSAIQQALSQPLPTVDAIANRIDAIAETVAALPREHVDPRETLDRIAAEIAELRATQPDHREALQQLAALVAAIPTTQPDPSDELARIAAEIAELRATQPDLSEALQHLTTDVAALRTEQVDPTAALDRVEAEVAELRSSQPDHREALQRLATVIAELPTERIDPRPQLETLLVELAALRASQPDADVLVERLRHLQPTLDLDPLAQRVDEAASRLDARLGEQSEALVQLQSNHPQLSVRLDHLASDIAHLAERQQALALPPERFDELVQRIQEAQPELEQRLGQVQAELADLRSRVPDLDAALRPVLEHMERVAAAVGRLHEADPALARMADELAQLRSAQTDPSILQNFLAERVDRVIAEVAALRAERPDPGAALEALTPLQHGLDDLNRALIQLRDDVHDIPAPVIDLDSAIGPLSERMTAIDARAAFTTDAVAQVEGQLSRTAMQLEELTAAVSALRTEPHDDTDTLAPLLDRLAIVADAVSSMHGDVTGLAEVLTTVRSDRSQLGQLAADTNARLDVLLASIADLRDTRPDLTATNEHVQQLANAVADLRESRPDFTSTFVALTELVESLQASVTETRNRIDELHEGVRSSDVRAEMTSVVDPVIERLDAIAGRAAVTEEQIGTTLDDLAESVTRFDSEQAAAVRTHIDELRQAVHALGDRQANALMDVVQRFEQVSANAAATQDAIRAIDVALTARRDDVDDDRLGELTQQVATLAADVRSSVRSIVGLGSDLTALRTDVETLSVAIPDATENEASMRAALTGLDTTMADRDRQLREVIERLDREVTAQDADLRDALTRVYDTIKDVPRAGDVAAVTAQVETSLAELRQELQRVGELSAGSDVNTALRDVRADLHSTRSELQSISRIVGELREQLHRNDDTVGGAGAALVASAATAMARLEARMDGEFDSVGRQMEALGTLLGQVIDSVHRVETQMIGVHPMSERVRSSAANVLDALRTNVRQRAAHRQGPPPEIGSGDSY